MSLTKIPLVSPPTKAVFWNFAFSLMTMIFQYSGVQHARKFYSPRTLCSCWLDTITFVSLCTVRPEYGVRDEPTRYNCHDVSGVTPRAPVKCALWPELLFKSGFRLERSIWWGLRAHIPQEPGGGNPGIYRPHPRSSMATKKKPPLPITLFRQSQHQKPQANVNSCGKGIIKIQCIFFKGSEWTRNKKELLQSK